MRCPNCGAPGQSGVCEYCEVPLEDEEPVQRVVVEHYHFDGDPAPGRPINNDPNVSPKSRLVALLLCFFLGLFGAHRFYAGKWASAVVQIFTFGGIGIWWCIDFIMIILGCMCDRDGRRISNWHL